MTQQLLNNRYLLIKALATGGFGDTFLAEDTQMPSQRRCVIKRLKPISNNPQVYQIVKERFQREAAILEQLGDVNTQIPHLYAYFEADGHFYLIQQWIEGETLSQKVQQQGVLPENDVRDILISLLPVLDYIHSHRIVHRDIKPDNIIFRRQDQKPILIDFGAVKETMATVVNSPGNTTSSIVIGTPGFMPSEQTAGRPLYASDLYSLGLTAIYLLTGKLPQQLETDIQTGEIIWHDSTLNVSPSFAAVLDKAIQSHPRDRYPTAKDMLEALQSSLPSIPPTINIYQPAPIYPNPTLPPPATLPIQTAPTNSGNRFNALIFGSMISLSLIVASLVIAYIFKPSPEVVTKTNSPSPQSSPTPINNIPSSNISTTNPPSPQSSPTPINNIPSSNTSPTVVESPQDINTPTSSNFNIPAQQDQTDEYAWLTSRRVTEADLTGRTAVELDIMRNSIYARHGRTFRNSALQSHFNKQSWYRPIYSPDEFTNNLLSDVEKWNAAYILKYQKDNKLTWFK
ncbi:serine/threonine protein kinase [Crinalium epipsammum PCC 9333]|uniref:non-specific serine/threonine protein kinase n=1 Tax=Crinalium epipsammum PCC 9333 TaxID=1173022 RepID=K9W356_9CYAN|nr:YARHG domain-containing protein [Crinalium epipsammum]AFZ14793.1 serine/threonine protein kinase [Crinalium epipsammum PCC 9333]